MKKLRIILLFSFFIIVFRCIYVTTNYIYKTKYNLDDHIVRGYIISYKIDGNKLDITVKGKEKIKAIYYFNTLKEKNDFKYKLGDEIELDCHLKIPNKNTNFHLFNYNKYLKSKKIYYICNCNKISLIKNNNKIRYIIKNKIIDRINNISSKDYLNLFILGNKDYFDKETMNDYRGLGISHLFAISGMHISFLTTFLLFILNKYKFKYLLINSFLIFYIFLTDFSSSILRATLFFIFLSLLKKIKPIYILLLVLNILLLYNPYYIYDIGFILSFVVSFGLIMCNHLHNINNYFIKIFNVSIVSFLVSLPIIINNFFEVNLLSPIFNIVFVPLISIVIFPLSLLVFLIPRLSIILDIFINMLELLSNLLNSIDMFKITLSYLELPYFIIYYVFIIFILYKFQFKKYFYFLLIILILFVHTNINYLNNEYTITMIDVQQGDSILVQIPHNKNILIDTGGIVSYGEAWQKKTNNYSIVKSITIPYLKSIGIKKLDYLIITHGDYDHMGEAINLVENFKVEKVIFNCGEFNKLEKELIKVLNKNKIQYYACIKELNIDDNKLYFLNNKDYGNENDNSSVIYTELNNHKFLFMGDASVEVEKDLIEKYKLQDIDVLKVGHHGSNTSSSKIFIDKINPKHSIISVGKNNRYGHPNNNVLDNLENSKIYRTDQDGSVEFKIKKNKLGIETCTP